MGLLYYIPGGATPCDDARLAKWGLAAAFARPPTPCGVVAGPDGGAGLVLADDRLARRVGYYPETQAWHDFGTVWVGVETDQPPPTPESLQRARMIRGHRVVLGDGGQWEVPVARAMIETPDGPRPAIALPQRCGLGPDGKWRRGAILADYADLWKIACDWWDAVCAHQTGSAGDGAAAIQFDFEGVLDSAAKALAVNYHLPPQAISALGLLSESAATEALMAVIDWPTLAALAKKKSPAEASSSEPEKPD